MQFIKKKKELVVDQQYIVKANWCVLYDSIIQIVGYSKEERKYYFKSIEPRLTHNKNNYLYKGSFKRNDEFYFLLKPYNPKKSKMLKNVLSCFKLGCVILKLVLYAAVLTVAYYGALLLLNDMGDITIEDALLYFNFFLQIVALISISVFCIKRIYKVVKKLWWPMKYQLARRKINPDEISR